jgi:predicted nucleic acid-binding protein
MTSSTNTYVVDASVGIKLVVPEAGSEHAERLFARLLDTQPITLLVPDLFYIECANVLCKKVRRQEVSAEKALQALATLDALALPTTAGAQLLMDAYQIATRLGIWAYDACYLALSQQAGVPLITADERLVRAAVGTFHVISLYSLT